MPEDLETRMFCACGLVYENVLCLRACLLECFVLEDWSQEFVLPVGLITRICRACGLKYENLLCLQAWQY